VYCLVPRSYQVIIIPVFYIDSISSLAQSLTEIYITRLQFALQRPNIRLKYIITDAMLEMLPWKPVTATSSYCIVQELTEGALEAEPYFMKVPSDPGLQNTKTELDGIEIRRIWRQISYLTPV